MRFISIISSLGLVSSSLATTLVAPLEGYAVADMGWSGMFNGELVNTTGTVQVSTIYILMLEY